MPYERKTYDIIISDDLKNILTEFESDSLVAKLLLKKRHDKESLVDNPINFISIAQDKSKISYLTEDRMSQLDVSEYWSSSRRFAARPGAFIGKIFKDIPGKEVEKFSNLYRSHTNKVHFTFKVVDGFQIPQYYHINSYAAEKGTLGASCMKYDSCQDYLGIYTNNSDVVKMLVMLNTEGYLLGRALLWNSPEHKIMDRIYTISDEELLFHFKKWATDNGYLYKSEQNWYNTLNFENLSTPKSEIKIDINIKLSDFRRYPYVDTFKFLNKSDGLLTNYFQKGSSFKTLCSSEGSTYSSDHFRFDDIDRVLRHPADCVYIEYLNVTTHCNNTHYSETNDQYILHKDCFYDEEINDYLFKEEYKMFNKVERIETRKQYLKTQREQSRPSLSNLHRNNWVQSLINRTITENPDMNNLSQEDIDNIYQTITSMGNFSRQVSNSNETDTQSVEVTGYDE